MLAICKTIAIPLLCLYQAPGKPLSLDPSMYSYQTPTSANIKHRATPPWHITQIKGPGGQTYLLADQFAYCTCRWPIRKAATAK